MTGLEDLKAARIDRPATLEDARDAIGQAKRRRRGRYLVIASVVAVLAVLVPLETLVVSGRRSEPARPLPVSRPTEYTGVGTAVKIGSGPLQLCLGWQFGSSPVPNCSAGVTLQGIDPRQLPGVGTHGISIFTKGSIRVVGTYHDGTFTLTRKPVVVKAEPVKLNSPVPCSAPPGGWNKRPLSNEEFDAIGRYERAHPATWGGSWFTPNQRILVTAFTGDLSSARSALRAYSGNLCVTTSTNTFQALQAAANSFTPTAAEKDRLHINEWWVDEISSRLVINTAIVDKPITDYIRAHFAPGLVRLNAALTPVPR